MIIDINAFAGHWPFSPVRGDLAAVRDSLRAAGVQRLCVSPLEAAWCRNPHLANAALYEAAAAFEDVWPVPVLDPTVATWRAELARAAAEPRVRLIRLLPAYSPYSLAQADELLDALAQAGLGVLVQTRLEDPRSQHPRAPVPDLPAAEVAEAAARHPELAVILGGARTAEIRALTERLLALPHFYADVSQADGLDAVRLLVAPASGYPGLGEKLLFGSHAPLFMPHAALARVVTDLADAEAAAILGGNAARVLAPKAE
jgi:predicted TIM-barrel fold metal-dependent hydrolase